MTTITPGTWQVDPTHTEVGFVVRHLAISKVRGKFGEFAGTVVAGDDLSQLTVEGTAEVKSIDTNQAQRDEHLRSSDFFKADEFPQITFKSTSVTADGDDLKVVGDLTMRGVTKPVEFEVEIGGETVDGYGNRKAGFEATAVVNRKEFGIEWNAPTEAGGLTLGDKVTINIDGQLALQA